MSDRVREAMTYFENSTHRITYLSVRGVSHSPVQSRRNPASCEFPHRHFYPLLCCFRPCGSHVAWAAAVGLASSVLGWCAGTGAIAIWEPGEGGPCIEKGLQTVPPPIPQPLPGLTGSASSNRPPPPHTHTSSAPVTSHSLLTSALSPDSWTARLTRLCCHS